MTLCLENRQHTCAPSSTQSLKKPIIRSLHCTLTIVTKQKNINIIKNKIKIRFSLEIENSENSGLSKKIYKSNL